MVEPTDDRQEDGSEHATPRPAFPHTVASLVAARDKCDEASIDSIPFEPHQKNILLPTVDERELHFDEDDEYITPISQSRKFWPCYFESVKTQKGYIGDLEKLLTVEVSRHSVVVYTAPRRSQPPPLGEIRMDQYGNEILINEDGVSVTAKDLYQLGSEALPLIRQKQKWCYSYTRAAFEKQWRGFTDPGRDQEDEAILARRHLHMTMADRDPSDNFEQDRTKREVHYDTSWRLSEVLQDFKDASKSDFEAGTGMFAPHYPEEAFHSQLRYLKELARLVGHQNMPIDIGHIPSYELRSCVRSNGRHRSRYYFEQLREDLYALDRACRSSSKPLSLYTGIWEDLCLFKHMVQLRAPLERYPQIHSDFFILKDVLTASQPSKGVEADRVLYRLSRLLIDHEPSKQHANEAYYQFKKIRTDLWDLKGLMAAHEPVGPYEEIEDDLILLQNWVCNQETQYRSWGLYEDVHLLRQLISTHSPPWLYTGIEDDLNVFKRLLGKWEDELGHSVEVQNVLSFIVTWCVGGRVSDPF